MHLNRHIFTLGGIATLALLSGCSESPDAEKPSKRLGQTSTGETMIKGFADNMLKAKSGNVEAQKNIGNSYFFGEGIAKNYSEAEKWYRTAALQGNAEAQYNLATLILKNTHPSDSYRPGMLPMTEAYAFFILAASTDYKDARQKLALFEYPEGKLNRAEVATGQRYAERMQKEIEEKVAAKKAGK